MADWHDWGDYDGSWSWMSICVAFLFAGALVTILAGIVFFAVRG